MTKGPAPHSTGTSPPIPIKRTLTVYASTHMTPDGPTQYYVDKLTRPSLKNPTFMTNPPTLHVEQEGPPYPYHNR